MKHVKLQTIQEYNELNDTVSTYRGYPDNLTGTARYAPDDPLPVEVKDEDENVTETYYMFPLTSDIEMLVSMVTGKEMVEA